MAIRNSVAHNVWVPAYKAMVPFLVLTINSCLRKAHGNKKIVSCRLFWYLYPSWVQILRRNRPNFIETYCAIKCIALVRIARHRCHDQESNINRVFEITQILPVQI